MEEMCLMTGVSRASLYSYWQGQDPRQAEMALQHSYYGYRRITAAPAPEGLVVVKVVRTICWRLAGRPQYA
jgi:carbamate kinase